MNHATTPAARWRGGFATSVMTVAVTVLALFSGSPAHAVDTPADPAETVATIPAAERANLDAVLAASDNSGDTAVFDIDRALELGADEAAAEEFALAFVASGGVLADTSSAGSEQLKLKASMTVSAKAACRGRTGYTGYYWFGPQSALDSCLTTGLINGIGIAAAGGGTYTAASALTVAGLPSSAVVGVVSAVLALGVAFLTVCRDTSSLGAMYLNGGVPGVVAPSCWAQ